MNSVLIPLKETVVSAQKSVTLQRFEVGVEKINIASFKLLPTSMGESDIIKSVLLFLVFSLLAKVQQVLT